jgi:hypothetical protein
MSTSAPPTAEGEIAPKDVDARSPGGSGTAG